MDTPTLRELFRHLLDFRALYENERIDEIVGPDGESICLWDVEYLYAQVSDLTRRQQQAIHLFLVLGYREREAAEIMGLSPTNPIGMYVSVGLDKIVARINAGELPRYRPSRTLVA